MTEIKVSEDDDVNWLFGEMAKELIETFDHSDNAAAKLAKDYYVKFTSEQFCRSIGIPIQDHEFFHHESAGGLALRAQYYLVLQGDPDPYAFIQWRTKRYEDLRNNRSV